MGKILYDKLNKQIANVQWFTDQDGNYWIDTDPNGAQMSGNVTIKFLKKDHAQYEVREVKDNLYKLKEIAFGNGSSQERMADIKKILRENQGG